MSSRLNASGEKLSASTNLPSSPRGTTLCGIFYMVTDRNNYTCLLSLGADADNNVFLETDVNGTSLVCYIYNSGAYVATSILSMSTATWYFIAMTVSSAGAVNAYYANLTTASSLTKVACSGTVGTWTPAHIMYGESEFTGEWFNGRISGMRAWTTELTQAQLEGEMWFTLAQHTTSLNRSVPSFAGSGERARDYSGNGYNLTEGGTLSDEDDPPVLWTNYTITLIDETAASAGNISGAGNIASAEAFGTNVVSASAAPAGIASSETLGSPAAQASLTNISGIASAEAFGTPTVNGVLSPSGIASGEAVGSPSASVNITASGISSAEAIGTPSVSGVLAPSGIASDGAFGSATLSLSVSPSGIASGEAIANPVLSVNIASAGNIASNEAFGSPSVSTSAVINLSGVGDIASSEAFGTPAIACNVNTTSISSGEVFGSPTLSVNIASAGNISSSEAFGSAAIRSAVSATGIGSSETFGNAALGVNIASAGNIPSGETFGNATISILAAIQISDAGNIASVESFGSPTLSAAIAPAGIASSELFGSPVFMLEISAQAIPSDEAFGNAAVYVGDIHYGPVLVSAGGHDQLTVNNDRSLQYKQKRQLSGVQTRNLK